MWEEGEGKNGGREGVVSSCWIGTLPAEGVDACRGGRREGGEDDSHRVDDDAAPVCMRISFPLAHGCLFTLSMHV